MCVCVCVCVCVRVCVCADLWDMCYVGMVKLIPLQSAEKINKHNIVIIKKQSYKKMHTSPCSFCRNDNNGVGHKAVVDRKTFITVTSSAA